MEDAHQHAAPTKSKPPTTGYYFLWGFTKYLVYANQIREFRHGWERINTSVAPLAMQCFNKHGMKLMYARLWMLFWYPKVCIKTLRFNEYVTENISVCLLIQTLLCFESRTIIFDDPYISYTSLRGFTHPCVNTDTRITVNHNKFY